MITSLVVMEFLYAFPVVPCMCIGRWFRAAMELLTVPWGALLLSAIFWFPIKPFIDHRTYIKIGVTFSITGLATFATVPGAQWVTLLGHSLVWTMVHSLAFWPSNPAASLYTKKDNLLRQLFLPIVALYFLACSDLSLQGLLLIGSLLTLTWKSGGNYMCNKPKSVVFSVFTCWFLTTHLLSDEFDQDIPFMSFVCLTTVLYCSVERCIAIADIWPSACGGQRKSLLWRSIYSFISLDDEDLPLKEIEDISDVLDVIKNPKDFTTFCGYLMFDLLMPQGVRVILCPLALLMKRLDDWVDNGSITKEVKMEKFTLVRKFCNELFQGREEDWAYGLWPRKKGTPSAIINLEFYERQLATFIEPFILRATLMTSDYISPKVVYDLLEIFEQEVNGWEVREERDLLYFTEKSIDTILHAWMLAYLLKGYLMKPSEVPKELQEKVVHSLRLGCHSAHLIDIASDIVTDSLEGKNFIPKDWFVDKGHYKLLKKRRDPWILGKGTLQIYARKFTERVRDYGNMSLQYLDEHPEVVEFYPPFFKRTGHIHRYVGSKIVEALMKREEFSPNPLEGCYFPVFLGLIRGLYLPIKTSAGWVL